jgi:hypothetical protein
VAREVVRERGDQIAKLPGRRTGRAS